MNRLGREPVNYVSKVNRYEIRHIQSNLDQRRLLVKQTKVKSNNKIERCFGVIVTLFKFKESENFDQTL